MAKGRPNGLARGPEAEPAGQPLIAKLKQEREDSQAEVNERIEQFISQLTGKISKEIISKNRHMHVTHTEILGLPASLVLNRVKFGTARSFVKLIEEWAKENGIGCAVEKISRKHRGLSRFRVPALQMKCVEIHYNSVGDDKLELHECVQDRQGQYDFSMLIGNWDDHLLFCINFNWGAE
jgi:hypothetical protein